MGIRLNKVLEGYKPRPMPRMFYPRGMKLSEDFINAFHREYDRLVHEGVNPKTLVERVSKAMKFHVNDTRKYHQLDEEDAKKRERKAARRKGKQQTAAEIAAAKAEAEEAAKAGGETGITQT